MDGPPERRNDAAKRNGRPGGSTTCWSSGEGDNMAVRSRHFVSAGFGLLVVAFAFGLLFPRPAKASQALATWVGGTGNWNVATNWSPAVVPNNGMPAGATYKVRIDAGPGNAVVTVNGNFTIDQLTVDAGDDV